MIRCSNCGEPVAAGMATCRRCGLPLSGGVGSAASAADAQKGVPQRSELPAWLQSLRAGERLPTGTTGPIPLSAADLIDEDSLPSWMRAEQKEDTAEYQFPANSQFSGPAGYAAASPARGIAARSLIDEQALPSWMREGQEQESGPKKDIPASSLIEPDALPEWMRSLKPSTEESAAPDSSAPVSQEWARGAGREPGMTPMPGQPLQAHELIDPQQLPDWLRGQSSGIEAAKLGPAPGTGGAARLEASSLIDMNALPTWLREGQLESASSAAGSVPSGTQGSPASSSPPAPTMPVGSLTAASLIDMNALPEWLRSSMDTPAPAGSTGQGSLPQEPGRALPDPMQPRVENMRVPSRPRTELGVSEQSEAAANVFASLLGVASATPSLPTQGSDPRYGQTMPTSPPPTPAAGGAPSSAPAGPAGYPTGAYAGPSAGANPISAAPGYAAPPPSVPPASASGPGVEAQAQSRTQARPAKRSFLDVIRSWFPH
ncbi:zinc ribbon domain-containing protein [Thermogemmatispora sp.]|uniref:zinc ribbon domain-containing protein n=1 Tax=Thermogemmatispora sp. TaxID=1968838 RepID=UPI001D2D6A7A|nr:zinc ribbon domain-containing protein [Thermogemmatispora sp.]MBX5449054.1 zinc ribbon domain-containing protein [Thermogemmatispora sp.]